MATVYSSEVRVGSSSNYIRIKVDYSGTSATITPQFRRSSSYSTTWSDGGATITFNGSTPKSANYSYSGTVGTSWVNLREGVSGFTVSTSGGTYNWSLNASAGVLSGSGTVTIPAQSTPPTGLKLSDIVPNSRGFTATVSVTGWGTGGTTAGRKLEFSVCTTNGSVTNRRWKSVAVSSGNSATITVDNSSPNGNITIQPKTTYYLTPYATNDGGTTWTGLSSFTSAKTLAPSYVKNSSNKTALPKKFYVKNSSGKTALPKKLYAKNSSGKTVQIW